MNDDILKLVNTSNKRYDFDERINMLYYLKDYYPKNKFINSQLTDCQSLSLQAKSCHQRQPNLRPAEQRELP